MTNYSQRIINFIEWLKKSGYGVTVTGLKNPVVIPSEMYYAEYKLENPNAGDLFKDEKEFLKVKSRNIIFDLVLKGYVPQTAIKTLLAYYCNMNDKIEKKQEVEKPTVVFQMDGLGEAKPFITDENISFENEAIKEAEKDADNL